ncbi:MAG: hypothetical protein IPG96_15820 [Proteobacteria bacterium]|nr:hypothetical protein [Pseudomonadota bacterium]
MLAAGKKALDQPGREIRQQQGRRALCGQRKKHLGQAVALVRRFAWCSVTSVCKREQQHAGQGTRAGCEVAVGRFGPAAVGAVHEHVQQGARHQALEEPDERQVAVDQGAGGDEAGDRRGRHARQHGDPHGQAVGRQQQPQHQADRHVVQGDGEPEQRAARDRRAVEGRVQCQAEEGQDQRAGVRLVGRAAHAPLDPGRSEEADHRRHGRTPARVRRTHPADRAGARGRRRRSG